MKKLTLLSLLLLMLFSCRKDTDEMVEVNITSTEPDIIDEYLPAKDLLTASVSGYVFDESKQPVAGATVTLRGTTYQTDDKGFFYASNTQMDGEGTFFTVEKEGYFKGARRFFPQEGSIVYTRVQLMQLNEVATFDSGSGQLINGPGGISLSFPANAVKNENGELYDGVVRVAAKYLDPTSDQVADLMPGALQGVTNQLEEVSLVSYGMMAVELFGEQGEKLNVADGQTVELSFPIPTTLQSTAPDEIPLWFFEDERFGVWVEDGKAELVDDKYVGQVSHFSFWNCDDPFPLVEVTGRLVVDQINGAPILIPVPVTNTKVGVQVANTSISSQGYTDANGVFSGKMPKDVELILTFGDPALCNLSSLSIGPFSDDTDVGDIVFSGDDVFAINGVVENCDGGPVNNGRVEVSYGSQQVNIYLEGTNTFSSALLNCEGASQLSIVAMDFDSLELGISDTFDITPFVDVGDLFACGVPPYYFTLQSGTKSITYYGVQEGNLVAQPNDNPIYPDGLTIGFDIVAWGDVHAFKFNTKGPLPVGTYNIDHLESLNFFFNAPPFDYDVLYYEEGLNDRLKSFELDITVNEGVGGVIEGSFDATGDIQFDTHPDSILYNYPFSGAFKLLRE